MQFNEEMSVLLCEQGELDAEISRVCEQFFSVTGRQLDWTLATDEKGRRSLQFDFHVTAVRAMGEFDLMDSLVLLRSMVHEMMFVFC